MNRQNICVGDKVLIGDGRKDKVWITAMDEAIGQVGIITRISKFTDLICLNVSNINIDYWYPIETLKPIEESTSEQYWL